MVLEKTESVIEIGKMLVLTSAIIAGMLIDRLGTSEAVFAASLVYILAGFLFAGIHNKGDKEASERKGKSTLKQYRVELVQGWIYIFQNKKVLYVSLATSMVLPFFYSINTLIALTWKGTKSMIVGAPSIKIIQEKVKESEKGSEVYDA